MEEKNINIEKLRKELDEAKKKCEEYLDGWKRERADFLNHKKEEIERIGIIIKYANEELILKILPILDNICLAESHAPEDLKEKNPSAGSGQAWIDGFLQIKKQLSDFLLKEGIEPIEVMGKQFDPNTMEAVEKVDLVKSDLTKSGEEGEEEEKDIVVEEVQRGYTMHGKVIRPAKVKISK